MNAPISTDSIWSHMGDDLRRFIRRRVADEHLAEDLLQEVFVRIHRHLGSLEDEDRLVAWVYQIARNVIHDYYRRSADRPHSLEDAEIAVDSGKAGIPWQAGSAGWMHELIDQLPETYREAVRLSELEGLTQQQIADRLGLSLSGAKSRVQRGRTMLKGVLEQCCRFEFDRRGNLLDIDPRPDRTVCRDCES